MQRFNLAAAIFGFVGAGSGAILAKVSGVTSWLDARLYIAVGLVTGLVVSKLVRSKR